MKVVNNLRTKIKDFIDHLSPDNPIAKGIVGLASGTILSQALLILASPVLTRLYSPADFGVLSLFVSIIAIAGVVASLRYEFALPIASDKHDVVALIVIGATLTFVFSIISCLTILIAWEEIEATFNLRPLRTYKWMIPVGIATVGIFNLLTFWATREKLYSVLARSKLTQSMGVVSTQIAIVFIIHSALGLIAGDVVGRMVGILHIGRNLVKSGYIRIQSVFELKFIDVLIRYKRFPLLSAPASFFNTLGLRLPVILIATFYSIEAAGWLMLSQMIVGGPLTLIGQSVSRVYSGEMGQCRRDKPDEMESLFIRISVKLALYCTLPILILAIIAPMAFELVFGSDWYTAGLYTRLLALMLIAQIIVNPVSSTLTLLEKQELQLLWDILRVLLVIASFWFSVTNGTSDLHALAIYCGVMVILYIILWCLSLREIRNYS